MYKIHLYILSTLLMRHTERNNLIMRRLTKKERETIHFSSCDARETIFFILILRQEKT